MNVRTGESSGSSHSTLISVFVSKQIFPLQRLEWWDEVRPGILGMVMIICVLVLTHCSSHCFPLMLGASQHTLVRPSGSGCGSPYFMDDEIEAREESRIIRNHTAGSGRGCASRASLLWVQEFVQNCMLVTSCLHCSWNPPGLCVVQSRVQLSRSWARPWVIWHPPLFLLLTGLLQPYGNLSSVLPPVLRTCHLCSAPFLWMLLAHPSGPGSESSWSGTMCVLSPPIMSNSLHPCGLQPASLLCPWDFPRQRYWSRLPFLLQDLPDLS